MKTAGEDEEGNPPPPAAAAMGSAEDIAEKFDQALAEAVDIVEDRDNDPEVPSSDPDNKRTADRDADQYHSPFDVMTYMCKSELHHKDKNIQLVKELLREDIGYPLIAEGKAYQWGGDIDNVADLRRVEMKNTAHACVYYVERTGKVGSAKRGTLRAARYDKDENIIAVFYYDYADDDVMGKLEGTIAKIEKLDSVHINPTKLESLTIEDLKKMDEGGPSVYYRLMIHSLTHGVDDSPFGGGAGVKGVRRAVDVLHAETAITCEYARRGVDIDDGSAMDEYLHSRYLEWYDRANHAAADAAKSLFEKLEQLGFNGEAMDVVHVLKSTLSWPPGGEHKFDAATIIIVKLILGVLGRADSDTFWEDPISVPPPDGPYDSASYHSRPDLLSDGFDVIAALLELMESSSASIIRLLDTNKLIMDEWKGQSILEWLESRVVDENNPEWRWREIHRYLDVVTMALDKGDGKLRLLFVHRPLCHMLYAGPYVDQAGNARDPTVNDYRSQAKRAEEGHFLYFVSKVLRTEGATLGSIDRDGLQIWGNLLFAFTLRMYGVNNLHEHKMVANLFAKAVMTNCKLLDGSNHALVASKRGVIIRQQRAWARQEKAMTDKKQEIQIQRHLLYQLSGEGAIGDKIDGFFNYLSGKERVQHDREQLIARFFGHHLHEESEWRSRIQARIDGERDTKKAATIESNKQWAKTKAGRKRRAMEERRREEREKLEKSSSS